MVGRPPTRKKKAARPAARPGIPKRKARVTRKPSPARKVSRSPYKRGVPPRRKAAAAKKPAARKPAARKPAARKPAARKPAARKPAPKPAARKPAAKEPAYARRSRSRSHGDRRARVRSRSRGAVRNPGDAAKNWARHAAAGRVGPSVWCEVDQKQLIDMCKFYGLNKNPVTLQKIGTVADPNRPCKVLHELFPVPAAKNYDFVKFLGQGEYGHVYKVRDRRTGRHGALKIQLTDNDQEVKDEVAMQRKMHSMGLAPAVHAHATMRPGAVSSKAAAQARAKTIRRGKKPLNKSLHLIFMAKVDGVLDRFMRAPQSDAIMKQTVIAIMNLVDKLEKKKMCHGDLHLENLAYIIQPGGAVKLQAIDCGMTTSRGTMPVYDFLQAYRTSDEYFARKMNSRFRKYFRRTLRQLVFGRYGVLFPTDHKSVDKLYKKMGDQYHRKYL